MKAFIRKLREPQSSRNAAWMFLGQGTNILLQAGYFLLLARLLGVEDYGAFAGAFALVTFWTPYSALGAGMLFMRYVTADRTRAAVYWGNSMLVTTAAASLIAGALFFLGPALTRTHNHLLFAVLALANCLFSQITNLASVVFQTFEKMRWTAMLGMLSSFNRFAVLLLMRTMLHHASAFQWSIGMLVASGCAAAVALSLVRAEIGPAMVEPGLILRRVREGIGFSFAGTTQVAYNDLDKVMLSHYGLNRENGFYTLAYRVIDAATMPIIAVNEAILPRFFRLGEGGLRNVAGLALRSAGIFLLLGLTMAATILLFAPALPHLAGPDYSSVLIALRWLCWIPLLRGIHRAMGTALTSSGHQSLRTASQLLVATANLLLNLWWIPMYGWIGAAWSSVASDALLAGLNSLMLGFAWKRDGRGTPALVESESVLV